MRTLRALACVLLMAACGSTEGGADAPVGGPDADPTPDAEVRQPVTMTVFDFADGDELDDVPVLFFDPDGTFVEEVDTDDDGVASAAIFSGGTVVAMYPNTPGVLGGPAFVPIALVNVPGGADLRLGTYPELASTTTAHIVADPATGAIGYRLVYDCGFGSQSATASTPEWTIDIACERASFVVIASDAEGAVAVAYEPDVALDTELVLASDYEDADGADLRIDGMPDDAVDVSGTAYLQLPGIQYAGPLLTSLPFEEGSEEVELEGALPELDDALVFSALVVTTDELQQQVYDVRPVTDDADLSARLLSVVDDLDLDDDGVLTWDEDVAGQVDFVGGFTSMTVDGVATEWIVSGRPTDGRLVLPTLPEDWEDFAFANGEDFAAQLLVARVSPTQVDAIAVDPILAIYGGGLGLIPDGEGTSAYTTLSFAEP